MTEFPILCKTKGEKESLLRIDNIFIQFLGQTDIRTEEVFVVL